MILQIRIVCQSKCRKPRASGDDPPGANCSGVLYSVNPARAGMILEAVKCMSSGRCKPRASGDDPEARLHLLDRVGKPRASGDDPHLVIIEVADSA